MQNRKSLSASAASLLASLLIPGCSPVDAPPPGPNLGPARRPSVSGEAKIRISAAEADQIGKQIWKNECAGTLAGLTSWNSGEYFASLGIGHFIWYHSGKRGPFEESFPPLIRYLEGRGVTVPAVAKSRTCPWRSREQFLAAQKSPEMKELRAFLRDTIPLQTEFILRRLEGALPKMLAEVPAGGQAVIRGRFYAVAETAKGKYALMDYVNFKGEGTKRSERYKGQGWGMLQVLQEMRGAPRGNAAVSEYAAAADRVLTRRVANAPGDESRWLAGWRNRLKTYRP